MDPDRELWDPDVQARPPAQVAGRAQAAFAAEWSRVWEPPGGFYRDRFGAAGLSASEVPPLDEIPRTTKNDLRANEAEHPPLGTHRAVGLEQAIRIGSSTGTTGKPWLIFYGPADLEAHVDVGTRNVWRHGLRAGDRFTHSWPQGLYPTGVSGGRNYLAVGVLEIPVGPPFSPQVAAEHLSLWDTLRPTGFMVTGSQLQLYESVAADEGIDFSGLLKGGKLAFLEASCQYDGPRQRVESTYGVQLRNISGASEVPGFSTSDCRFHTGLHAAGDHFVVQACDPDTGREVPPGERGTLVVTAFGIDSLFIRYDVEDIVTVSTGTCPCGETGPRYTLLGRAADMAKVDGRMVLPLDVQLALEEVGAPEFQVIPGEQGALHLKVESEGAAAPFEGAIRESLGVSAEVETIPVGTLPRSTFKPRRIGN